MHEDEHGEGKCSPEPAHFDEKCIEKVPLLRKVRWGKFGRVRLRECGVRCGSGGGVEEGEERAEKES